MNTDAQLERIAAVVPPNRVQIYQLGGVFDTWCWLCAECLEARKAVGWCVKESKEPPHALRCDDCETGDT